MFFCLLFARYVFFVSTLFGFCAFMFIGCRTPGPSIFSLIMSTNSDNLVIYSLNVRALSNEVKRRETFNWLRNKKYCLLSARSAQFKKSGKTLVS